jgi:anti-anti-sigma factor
MEITLSMVDGIPLFQLVGRLDATTSPVLEERLQPVVEEAVSKIIFGCEDLSYVSSAGLRIFLSTQRHLVARGGGVAFTSPAKPVRDLFHLAGLEELFLIEESPAAAAARLNAAK